MEMTTPTPKHCAHTTPPSAHALQLGYALAKQIPDMQRGFVIATSYGDIHVPAGRLAGRLQAVLHTAMCKELARLEQGRVQP